MPDADAIPVIDLGPYLAGESGALDRVAAERDLREHSAGEACSVAMVYRALGVKPQCGKCVPFVRQMLRQAAEPTLSCQAAAAAT